MKKQYMTPAMEITTVYALCSVETASSGDTTSNPKAKERDDEEIYESEGGNYGDLW